MKKLRIVSVNDVYVLENLPRLKSLVEHYRTHHPADAFIVALAGDFLAPSILSSIDAGRGMVDCINSVGVTHVILGNHEDDLPREELHARLRELSAVCLGTNVIEGFDFPKSVVLDVGGLRVGLVGVVMDDPSMYRGQPFGAELAPANEAALAETKRLLASGCTTVVAMTHQSVAADRELAHRGRYPVIIGGHEHVPVVEDVGGTWIVKAGSEAVHAVITELVWDPDLRVTTVLDDVARYPEDAELRAKVDRHMQPVRELAAATMLYIEPGARLTSIGVRYSQTSFGTLLCSRLRDALEAEACIFNGGGIRASREYVDRLTYGDIEAEVPFDNEIVVAHVPGDVLRDSIVVSRSHAPFESGAYLQVDDAMKVEATVLVVNGLPFDAARTYALALPRELLFGLDHIEPLVKWARANPHLVPPAGSGREPKMILVQAFAVAIWKELGGFDAIDVNHDDRVTPSEIAGAIHRLHPSQHPPTILADIVVRALDRDADKIISREDEALIDQKKIRRPK